MKKVFTCAVVLVCAACNLSREVQADLTSAELVKIDTVFRYSKNVKLLTWRCEKGVEFVSFVGLNEPYAVGSHYRVLLTK